MKKIITLLLLFSSLCFGSEFKYYKQATLEQCTRKLNELNMGYKILSYKIIPAEDNGSRGGWITLYNMIIEVEERFAKNDK